MSPELFAGKGELEEDYDQVYVLGFTIRCKERISTSCTVEWFRIYGQRRTWFRYTA
jgi:hypothetical protein